MDDVILYSSVMDDVILLRELQVNQACVCVCV